MSWLVHFLTHSILFWTVLLVLYLLWWYSDREYPQIYKTYDKDKNHVGDLCADGSEKTSGVEKEVLASLVKLGYSPLPSSVRMVAKDDTGKIRLFTPDIILWKQKVIVEVDPRYTHGGISKIIHDLERNMGYTITGWKVVRVRIGWGTKADAEGNRGAFPYAYLHPHNDLVIYGDKYDHGRHGRALASRIEHALPGAMGPWREHHAKLTAIEAMGGFS